MRIKSLLIISLCIFASCSTYNRVEDEVVRVPATISTKCNDLITLFFKKNSYGNDKGLIHSLIEKAIVLSEGKILSSESLELRKESHKELFNYFFPESTYPNYLSLVEINALSSHLFDIFSNNTSLAKFHLTLQDLSFFTLKASYSLGANNKNVDEKLIEKDIKRLADFLARTNINSFSNLTEKDKEVFFNLFRDSDIQERRALYFKIKSIYMSSIYDSPVGEKIANIKTSN